MPFIVVISIDAVQKIRKNKSNIIVFIVYCKCNNILFAKSYTNIADLEADNNKEIYFDKLD